MKILRKNDKSVLVLTDSVLVSSPNLGLLGVGITKLDVLLSILLCPSNIQDPFVIFIKIIFFFIFLYFMKENFKKYDFYKNDKRVLNI